jgi:hypothetical protein
MDASHSWDSRRQADELERAAARMLDRPDPRPTELTHPELLGWLASRSERARRVPSLRLLWWDGELVDLAQAFGRADDLGRDARVVRRGDEVFVERGSPAGA